MQSVPCTLALSLCFAIFASRAKPASAQLEARIEIPPVDYTGREIDLTGDEHTIDWVKWGYPGVTFSEDSTLGPSALSDEEQHAAHTRRVTGGLIGELSEIVPEVSVGDPKGFFRYTTGEDGTMWFSWRDGSPMLSSSGFKIRGGLVLRQRALDNVRGYGVRFEVQASPTLRQLHLYVDCPDERSDGAMLAVKMLTAEDMREYQPEPICDFTNQRSMVVHIKFSARPQDIDPRLLVEVTSTGVSNAPEDAAVTLGAARLLDYALDDSVVQQSRLPLTPLSCGVTQPTPRSRRVGLLATALLACSGIRRSTAKLRRRRSAQGTRRSRR
jgi:hypothetical protein